MERNKISFDRLWWHYEWEIYTINSTTYLLSNHSDLNWWWFSVIKDSWLPYKYCWYVTDVYTLWKNVKFNKIWSNFRFIT